MRKIMMIKMMIDIVKEGGIFLFYFSNLIFCGFDKKKYITWYWNKKYIRNETECIRFMMMIDDKKTKKKIQKSVKIIIIIFINATVMRKHDEVYMKKKNELNFMMITWISIESEKLEISGTGKEPQVYLSRFFVIIVMNLSHYL